MVAYFIAAIKFTVSIIHVDFTQDLDTPADGTVPKIPIDSICASKYYYSEYWVE